MCCNVLLLILYLVFPGTTLVYGNLEYMTRLHKKCSRKVKAFEHLEKTHTSTQIFAKAVPLSDYEILHDELHLHWNFPIVDEELVSGLKRSKLVMTSKPFNSVDVPEIVLKVDNVTHSFTLPRPRFQEYVRFDLGNSIQNQGHLLQGVESFAICTFQTHCFFYWVV